MGPLHRLQLQRRTGPCRLLLQEPRKRGHVSSFPRSTNVLALSPLEPHRAEPDQQQADQAQASSVLFPYPYPPCPCLSRRQPLTTIIRPTTRPTSLRVRHVDIIQVGTAAAASVPVSVQETLQAPHEQALQLVRLL